MSDDITMRVPNRFGMTINAYSLGWIVAAAKPRGCKIVAVDAVGGDSVHEAFTAGVCGDADPDLVVS